MLDTVASAVILALGLFMALGTFLSTTHNPHWFVRGWDFPRVQIGTVLLLTIAGYLPYFGGAWWEFVALGAMALSLLWQLWYIAPYTPLYPTSVESTGSCSRDHGLLLLVTNVQQGNDQYERWREVVSRADPDVILMCEVDADWREAASPFEADYPHTVWQVQDNFYGMALLSKLELDDPEVRFLIQDDIPSVRAKIRLRDGRHVTFYGVHPRPPEPVRGTDSGPRDIEMIELGRAIGKTNGDPVIVAGDFNDVAWSKTTRLFQQLSGLLDPRRGRGMYTSFNAKSRIFRFPLDHIFHSDHFRLGNLRRLDRVGSDHFPILIHLEYEPDAPAEQEPPEHTEETEEDAQERTQQASSTM